VPFLGRSRLGRVRGVGEGEGVGHRLGPTTVWPSGVTGTSHLPHCLKARNATSCFPCRAHTDWPYDRPPAVVRRLTEPRFAYAGLAMMMTP
jgi:hypothetical protein